MAAGWGAQKKSDLVAGDGWGGRESPPMRTSVRFGPPSVEKSLAALPVVAAFGRRLDVAGTIDRLCPVRDVAIATHGQVIETLIANRLSSPAPLVHVEDWARAFAVPEVYGIDADTLNDDRIGRALDAIAPHLDEIVGSIGARAITEFGIDVSRLHWDMTSISLIGDYDSPDAGFITPSYGKPKDRRVDRKQVQTGLAVTGDGGIPVFHRAYDGKAGEVNQVVAAMEALKTMAGEQKFLLVGDSKLVSYTNLSAIAAAEVTFVAPAAKSHVSADVLAACDKARAVAVAYVPERHTARTTPGDPPTYLVYEDTMVIAGPRKADPVLDVRRVFVWSSGNAQAAVTNRARKCDRATIELDKIPPVWAAAITKPKPRYEPRSRRSAGTAASATTCASRPAPAPTTNRRSPGISTLPPSTPKLAPTAGTPC